MLPEFPFIVRRQGRVTCVSRKCGDGASHLGKHGQRCVVPCRLNRRSDSLESRLQCQVLPTPSLQPWHPLPDTASILVTSVQMGVVDEELFALEDMVRSEKVLLEAELNLGQGCEERGTMGLLVVP